MNRLSTALPVVLWLLSFTAIPTVMGEQAVPANGSKTSGAEKNEAAITPPPLWTYTPYNRKDPFQAPPDVQEAEERPQGAVIPEKPKRTKEFLESFELDSLKLVATIFQIEGEPPVAMVEDPMGVGHLVAVGHHLGAREGRIKEIKDGMLILEEQVNDKTAPQPTRTVTLKLSREVAP
ncbi:MAG: pilus assembly protein PilP [Magnetococcales bacterium]|nr:pilus assembly protein PilP [Magnetococcales bacterium]